MDNLKKLFNSLQTDSRSILFTEERINHKLLKKKLNKLTYEKDEEIVNLFNENTEVFEEKKLNPIKTPFVEKKDEIDRCTLYSLDGSYQLLHADRELGVFRDPR